MKNLTRKSLVVVGLMMSLSIFANDTAPTIKENEKKVIKIHFDNVAQGSTLIIKDVNGLVLYNEAIDQKGDYSKGFDLTTLPNGKYFFELNSEFKLIVKPFQVASNEVIFDKESEESIYKPLVRTKDNMVYVSRTAMEQTSLSYKIYYADNYDLVHKGKFEDKEAVKKVYDFSTAKKGNYVFVFESNGREFTKSIKM